MEVCNRIQVREGKMMMHYGEFCVGSYKNGRFANAPLSSSAIILRFYGKSLFLVNKIIILLYMSHLSDVLWYSCLQWN